MKSRLMYPLTAVLSAALATLASAIAQPGLVSQRTVAPGVVHKEFTLPGPYTLDVLAVETDNPFITLESYKPDGLTKTTVQAAANDRPGHRVIGAVNADFFSFETGWPVGNQVVNGIVALGINSSRSHIAVDTRGKPHIERLAFQGTVRSSAGTSHAISRVNSTRAASTMAFYTSFRGTTTGTDGSGAECAIEFLDTPRACDTLRALVTALGPGNMTIPENGGILSAASGTPAAYLSGNLHVGDTIRLYLGFNHPLRSILQVLGGAGKFLSGGRNVTDSMAALEGITATFTDARHPRTFVGFNADTSIIYLCTVDGRQSSSIGMTFDEMASFMLSLGATDAFNFDGGGSTTMVVRGEITNSPSDPAGERSVANSLQVISNAPLGTLHFLDVSPGQTELFQGGTQQFSATGTDEYYNPIAIPGDAVWEADPAIGTISPSGLFTAAKTNDSGWVKLRWNTVVDSAWVVVHQLDFITAQPSVLVMVPGERVTMLVRAQDSAGRKVTLNNTQMTFSTPVPAVNVDAAGVVSATDFGAGTVEVSLDTMHVTVPFNFSGNDTAIVVEPMQSLFPWDTTLVNLTGGVQVSLNSDPAVTDPPALRIAYSIPDARGQLQLRCNIPLSGRIDSLFIRVYGGGNGDTVRFVLKDKDGDLFLLTPADAVTWSGEWRVLGRLMSKVVPFGSSALDYPVSIMQVQIGFGRASLSGGTITGALMLDNLSAHYPLRTVAPQVLFDFEGGITGWYTPQQANTAQQVGIDIAASTLVASSEQAYQGTRSGKWTFVDDAASSADWDVRITRNTSGDLGNMLRGSYIGAWVYANGETSTELQTVVRGGNGQICAGPRFPVHHYGWKLIGTRLDENLFTPYLTSGVITDAGNKFNGFRLRGPNSVLSGQTRVYHIDKLVTSALTVPTGFTAFAVNWSEPLARLHWSVNSEISINRYAVERGSGGVFAEIGSMQGGGNVDTTVEYEYVDTPPAGTTVEYRIRQITNDGGQELSQPIIVNTSTSSVRPGEGLPRSYELMQNYPNPFNPSTTISYALPCDSQVTLTIFNTLGQRVAEPVSGVRKAGYHSLQWQPTVASGVYFYRLQATGTGGRTNAFSETRSLLLLR